MPCPSGWVQARCGCDMQVAQGMLWVWGDSSPAAHIHAAATPAHTATWMDMTVHTYRHLLF